MTLQSQAPRTQSSRVSTQSGASPWPRVAGIGAVVVVALGLGYFWLRAGGPPAGTTPGSPDPAKPAPAGVAGAAGTTNPVTPNASVGAPSGPAPVTLTMGVPAGSNPPVTAPSTTNPGAGTTPGSSTSGPTGLSGGSTPGTASPGAASATTGGPATTPSFGGLPAELKQKLDAATQAMSLATSAGPGKLLEARGLLTEVLNDDRTPASERRGIRGQLSAISDVLLFSPTVAEGDPLVDSYIVAEGDNPTVIVRKQALPIESSFLLKINGIADARRMRIGQKLKIVRVPFHVVVHKDDYRMDLYMGPPPSAGSRTLAEGQDEHWTYIRSFPVGLGESNGTPEGAFVVRPKSKLTNPRWVNPRTGEVFQPDDPKNPIGEHWIGLDGTDANTAKFAGYGIHGTTEPDSIGQSRSMGCVRMHADDVALVYGVLLDRVSTVRIVK